MLSQDPEDACKLEKDLETATHALTRTDVNTAIKLFPGVRSSFLFPSPVEGCANPQLSV
jgi:hypothetical protein